MALSRDLKISALEEKIHARVREAMDKSNHDYYLREQIHAIQEELGEDEDEELRELRARLRDSKIDGEARERTEKELARLARTSIDIRIGRKAPFWRRISKRCSTCLGREDRRED